MPRASPCRPQRGRRRAGGPGLWSSPDRRCRSTRFPAGAGCAALMLLVAACATAPPERVAREEAMWAAARQCQSQFTTIANIDGIDAFGRLRYTCLMTCNEREAFET